MVHHQAAVTCLLRAVDTLREILHRQHTGATDTQPPPQWMELRLEPVWSCLPITAAAVRVWPAVRRSGTALGARPAR